jgi:3',5'-cyclic AMP phosphodiesterase CpdA
MIIAQISDTHIANAGAEPGLAGDNAVPLQRAVEHLLRLPARPDVVLITGDCVEGGSASEYQRFRSLIRPLTMPAYVVPGNHDRREHLLEAFGIQGATPLTGFVQYAVEGWPVRLLGLDTNIPGQGGGELCGARLQWLEERLAEQPARPTIIFMHHPPFATGLTAFDQIGLAGADALGEIIARHPQVERIVAGHVHSSMLRRFYGSLAMTCPSTAHQMLPDFDQPDRLAAIMEPPACLLHTWRDTAGLITHTSQIGDHGPLKQLHDGVRWLA